MRGLPRQLGRRKLITAAIALLLVGTAYAGWRMHRATDTTLIDPIDIPAQLDLRSGDIIVAGGVSLQSRLVRTMTDDNQYSHVGLIEATPEGIYVIHSAPEGEGDGGVGNKVARIPLSLFLSERGYVAVRVMRLDRDPEIDRPIADSAHAFAARTIEQGVPFDGAFDLSEQDKMYCSELVYLAYVHAGYQWPDTLVTSVSSLLVDGPVILPDAFTQCDDFKTVWQHQLKGQ